MARVVVTESADRDTDEIVTYLAGRGGPPTARKYLRLFDDVYERLREFPGSGHPRARLGPDARVVIVPPYLIIYDWDAPNDTVTILRILRMERRLTRKLVRG